MRKIWRDGAKRWRDKNKTHALFLSAKTRAKKRNIIFNLCKEDMPTIPTNCPILGIPIVVGNSVRKDNSPSLDRIDNSKGYVKGNVRVISFRANRLKSDASLEDYKAILKYLEC